jgi:two-component system OmpR family sensor kinase
MMGRMAAALRSLVPDTIVGRAVAILLLALALSHLLSMAWYRSYLSQQADLADERVAAERVAAVKQAVMALPPGEREGGARGCCARLVRPRPHRPLERHSVGRGCICP